MLNIVNKLFGSGSKKLIKSYSKIVKQINDHEPIIAKFSDTELQEKTSKFRKLLKDGIDINEITIPKSEDGSLISNPPAEAT